MYITPHGITDFVPISVVLYLVHCQFGDLCLTLQGAEELDIGGGSQMRAQVEVAQMKEQLESQV